MKRLSVKVKITIWYALLMILMAALLLTFLLLVSGSVTTQTAMEQLERAVRANLRQVHMDDDTLELGEDFSFYDNGVFTLIYSQSESLLAGQVPVAFTAEEPFQNGLTRPVSVSATRYYVLDFFIPMGWDGGVWIRGILEAPEHPRLLSNLIGIAMVVMPVFIALAALGGYLIARRAFRPLDQMTATAAAINEAADLSARVDVPPGENELSQLALTFNQMFARLERAFEAEQQFTADASHELRTPVSVIKSACEYAEKYADTMDEQRETLTMIRRQADRMAALIGQLLSITRLDQGTAAIRPETANLTELVETVCREQAPARQEIVCRAQPGIHARVDAALIVRLLQNLIDNAIRYGREDGHVWVSLCRDQGEILLSVRDDGVGIPEEQQEKIWQRFYQVDPARSAGGGAGLGLSMVQKIAHAHGGTMRLESKAGAGSTFTLHLPQEGA